MGYTGAAGADLTLALTTEQSFQDNFDSNATGTNTTSTGSFQSTGLFLVTYKGSLPPVVLDIAPELHNRAGTTLYATVRGWNNTATAITMSSISVGPNQILFDVRDSASNGAVANPTTGDRIRLIVIGRHSKY
jgi:hypothetical protein